MKNLFIFRAFKSALSRFRIYKSAFSLVEMLMALLVASLLLAALAPVMTRKMNENLHITGEFTNNGRSVVKEIAYGDAEFCPTIVRDSNGDELYCEGEYTVPDGFKNITVTAIGAGGGGGTAPTAGYIEYINEGAAETFTVPAMVDNLEATLISGGAGGGAGGQVEDSVPYTTAGEFTWNVPAIAKNKYAVVTACGGGGGGGGFVTANYISGAAGGLGGGGGYFSRAVLASNNNYSVIIGGGGGGGAAASSTSYAQGLNGTAGSGGGGGGDAWGDQSGTGGRGGKNGGTAGYTRGALSYFGLGGERGDTSLSSNTDGNNGTLGSHAAGGNGSSAGGSALWGSIYKPDGTPIAHGQGAGGGGGSITGYGGGGGGGGCGGAGGGGGGGATIFGTRTAPVFVAAGGGGGGGGAIDDVDYDNKSVRVPSEAEYFAGAEGARKHGGGGGGGGGGGTGGGNGGNGGRGGVSHSANGGNGAGYLGSTIFGTNYCGGGTAFQSYAKSWLRNAVKGGNGKPGAMRITYLNYGPGGSGGGSGQIVPLQPVSVTPNEKLEVYIGKGASGGTAGEITASSTINNIAKAAGRGLGGNNTTAGDILRSKIMRNTDIILTTCTVTNGCGTFGGSPTGETYPRSLNPYHATHGSISTGNPKSFNYTSKDGFTNEDGRNAGDFDGSGTIFLGAKTYANSTSGGAGGKVTTPWFSCTPGQGGKSAGQKGTDASGYGCGGGGGFGLSDGGKGSGGYARLSWNMYWDTTLKAYNSKTQATGGGGASGNIIKETVRVNEGQVIPIKIGAGGLGAKVVNNQIMDATAGGETIFGSDTFIKIRAGGGGGGESPKIQDGKLVKGAGGAVSNICHSGSRDLHNNRNYCTQGTTGSASADNDEGITIGGLGAAFTYKFDETTYIGKSGAGGIQSTEYNNAKGQNAEGIAAGGGGAPLLIHTKIQNTSGLNHPQGGNGAPGRIILQLWE